VKRTTVENKTRREKKERKCKGTEEENVKNNTI
jgi:hypothetical protein